MTRKVIIDCDPGVDDAVALCLALFDPTIEVVAITAVEGCVPAEQANLNLHGLIERLDPPRLPRIGAASPADNAPAVDTRTMHGDDGLANLAIEASSFHHPHPSDKLIVDVVRANPGDITIVTLGPLTNLARAFRRDPQLASLVGQLYMSGGSPQGIGNITPMSEFNVYYDPISARDVFRARLTKTLVPLDVSRQVAFGLDMMEKLPSVESRVGRILKNLIPFFFRAYHHRLAQESINLNDVIGLTAAIHPEFFRSESMAGDVEVSGELTCGVTVFDRRPHPEGHPNMEVMLSADDERAREWVLAGLAHAASCTQ